MRCTSCLAVLAAVALASTGFAAERVEILTTGPAEADNGAVGVVTFGIQTTVLPQGGWAGRGIPVVEVLPLAAWDGREPAGPAPVVGADVLPRKAKVTFLGVSASAVVETLGRQLKLPEGTGLAVGFVKENSPAARADLKKHDVLTKLDDQILVNPPQLSVLVRMRKPGDKVVLTFIREGREQKATAELVEEEQVVWPAGATPWTVRRVPLPGGQAPVITFGAGNNPAVGPALGGLVVDQNAGPLRPGAAAMASASFSDGQHTLNLTIANGRKHLVATDANGRVLFDGPIDTPDQVQAVPEEIRGKLDSMQVRISVQEVGEIAPRELNGPVVPEVPGSE